MRVNEKMRKALSILLCLCMLLQNAPVMAFAVTTDNLCEHHTEHTAECGYREGSAGSACTHEHSEDCYAILECLHTCGEECADGCTHECTVENGCITMELDCHHVHGGCGYSEGTAEVPCGHVHNENCGYVEAVAGTPCANAETDPECDHSGDCGYVAAVEGQPCGHTACDDTCGYAPATEGTPCTHVCEVKVDSDDSCYKLLCSHSSGGHDDACGYAEAVEAHECHYECAECANNELSSRTSPQTGVAIPEGDAQNQEIATSAPDGDLLAMTEAVCNCGTDDPAIHAVSCAVYVAPENPVCYCTEKCTEVNVWCDVCGFDYTACTGTDTAAAYAEATIIASGDCSAEGSSVQWKYDNTGTLTISGTGAMADYTSSARPWEDYCDSITTLVIKDGVTIIGASAFDGCTGLTSVKIPNSVTIIGYAAFGYCTGLTSIEIPSSVTTIGEFAFDRCIGLVSIEIPNSVTTIGNWAFDSCTGLKSVTIPSSVTEIGDDPFLGCTNVSTVIISCTPSDAVYGCIYPNLERAELIEEHAYANGVCTDCGEPCPGHTGGEATCTEKAVCTICGASYGEVDTTNHDPSVECVNGFCPNGCYEPATLNAAGYYEIDNAGKLFWFAQQVNVKGNREIKGVLTANIDLENKPWTSIGVTGEENNNFRGVFDGQNYTIKGLYVEGSENGVGFFGEVRTGTVKNFRIYGNVVVNTEVDYVGGVIGSICGLNSTDHGLERNGAIIQNITSFVNVTAKVHGIGMIGGFVGYANHQSLIEKCAWYGTFDAGEYHVDSGAGGFIGHIYTNSSVTIRNCAAYGTIKTDYVKNSYNNYPTIYMGGFLSFSNTGAGTVLENCLFAGRFERGENLTDQAFLGAFGTLRSVNAIKNCYYLGDDGLEAVHSDSNLKPGSDNVEITSVTGEDLRNNTIATQLGDLWEQDVHYPIPKDTKAHSDSATYTYTDNGDGTHKATCNECGYVEVYNEAHSGGTATCTEQAECQHCGASYGELADHSTSYSADGMTITYKCATCDTQTVTFTLVIPTGAVYGGALEVPHYDSSDKTYQGDYPEITLDGALLKDFVPGAKTYEVVMTWGGKTVSGEYTIAKADVGITAPTPNTLTYTGEGQYLISAGEAVGGEMQYSTDNQTWSTTIPQGTDAGKYTVWYYVQGDDNHSDTAKASVKVTIAKADPVIGTVGCEMDLYDSTAVSNVVLTRTDMSVEGTLVLTDSELTAGEGTYNWKFTPKDTNNYNTITGTVVLNVTADVLEKIEASGTLEKDSYSYGDTFSIDGLTVTATYTTGATKDVTELVSFDNILAVGQTSVELTYQGKTCTVTGFTVAKKQLVVSGMAWDIPENAVYSGTAYNATLTGVLPEGVTVTKTGDTATNAGDYTAKAVFSLAEGYSADNYEIVNGENLTADWTIAKKNIAGATITLGTALTYNGKQQTQTVAKVEIDGLTVTYTVSGNTGTDAKGYTLTVTGDGNFEGTETKEWSIAKKNISGATITLGDSLTYNGNEQTQEVIEVKISDLAVTYDVTANKQTDAGNYTLTVTGNGNFEGSATADWSIAKAKLTITANNNSITYGDVPAANGVTGTGFVSNESIEDLSGELTYSYNYEQFGNVGTYKITPSGVTSNNYEITFADGTLTVNAKAITVTADAVSKTYGDADPKLTYKVEGLVNGDELTGELKRVAGENVGDYAIEQNTLTAGNNYRLTYTGAKLTINAKAITAADVKLNGSLTYNGREQIQPITVAEGITYEVSGNQATNAGAYELTVKGTGNYTGSVTLDWTIAKAKLTITADSKVIYIGEKLPTLTYTTSGLVGGDKLTKEPALTTNADADQAGSYTITAANADAGDNYTITYVSGSLTIMDKETEVETKIEQTELTEVPEGLKDTQFDTVEEIKEELISKILATSTGYSAENMVHYDVALHFSLDGGDSWILATEENFPTEGITVILPYPEGTNARDYEFVVSHMFTVTSQRLGTTAGDVELPKVEETANGIRVTLNGLSPVTVAARYHDHTGGTATCSDKAICSICGTAYGELDAANHAGGTEVKNAKEATCGAEGYTGDTHCKGCGEIVEKGAAIKATGEHTYGDWKVVKEPTKTAKGEKQRTCSVCGHVDSKEIPVLSDTPATGDDSNIMLYSAMFTVSLAGLVVLLLAAKKRKQENA